MNRPTTTHKMNAMNVIAIYTASKITTINLDLLISICEPDLLCETMPCHVTNDIKCFSK